MKRFAFLALAGAFAAQAGATTPTAALAQTAQRCNGGREFIVFFPAGASQLAGGAQGVIDAASKFAAAQPSRIQLVGYTDAAEGSNTGLSEARVDSVRTSLVAAGVPRARIAVAAMGDAAPAVKTDRAEPLNRRVTITVCAAPA